jgi:hypothetical protein
MSKTVSSIAIQTLSEAGKSVEKIWMGKCSFGCFHAKSDKTKCKCRCHGKLHGKAYEKHLEELKIEETADQGRQHESLN